MATVIVSMLTGIPVRRDIAMTGEITLRGRVLPIGGLKEKLLAALRGGIKKVLIPEDNAKDLAEIPSSVKNGLEIVPVSRMDEVLAHALVRRPTPIAWEEEVAAPPRRGRPKRTAKGSSRTDDVGRALSHALRATSRTQRKIAANSPEFAAFFHRAQASFTATFFAVDPRKRLRSFDETASYGSNSAVDSPGAAIAP